MAEQCIPENERAAAAAVGWAVQRDSAGQPTKKTRKVAFMVM
jgi:hypothetical protein